MAYMGILLEADIHTGSENKIKDKWEGYIESPCILIKIISCCFSTVAV